MEQPNNTPPGTQPIADVQPPVDTLAPPPAPAAVPIQTLESGGMPATKWYKGIMVTDVIAFAMLFTVLGLGIYYYRKKIKYMKSDQASIIDEVESLREDVDQIKNPAQMQFGG